jgi:phospholipid/cholesterol/gamma-HCH transport system permease protein
MIGMSMVRELVPLMTAVIVTGRTGAAIAAELGTMRVRSEIDALATMGISPVRFLIVPRIAAITVVGPALTLIGIFVGILGGMLVAALTLDMPAVTFWSRVVYRVTLLDFVHGLGKSLVFAWIIGLVGSHLGMRASGDASSVGSATTRTVVVSIFLIIVVDAVFATITTFARHG